MALSGSSTGWSYNTLFYSFKGKVSSLALQPELVYFDMLVVSTRNTYCLGKRKEKTREETVCLRKANRKLTWDATTSLLPQSNVSYAQAAFQMQKIQVTTQELEAGSRQEIDTFSITVVYKPFLFWFTELMENHLLEESPYHPLADQLPAGCDTAMPPLSGPLAFLRCTSRGWKKRSEAWRTILRFSKLLLNNSLTMLLLSGTGAACMAQGRVALMIHAGPWWKLPQLLSLLCT